METRQFAVDITEVLQSGEQALNFFLLLLSDLGVSRDSRVNLLRRNIGVNQVSLVVRRAKLRRRARGELAARRR